MLQTKLSGIDPIPPKHIKIVADFLTTLLITAINKSLEESNFPGSAKIASVVVLEKWKPNKNEISNFRPVSVLNTFSKFYEKVIKKQLVGFIEHFSHLISAYRTKLSSQYDYSINTIMKKEVR